MGQQSSQVSSPQRLRHARATFHSDQRQVVDLTVEFVGKPQPPSPLSVCCTSTWDYESWRRLIASIRFIVVIDVSIIAAVQSPVEIQFHSIDTRYLDWTGLSLIDCYGIG